LGAQLRRLLDAGVRIFHFDAGDGHFIQEITIGPIVLQSIAPLVHEGGAVLDCHLMVSQPERHFNSFKTAGADSVTFHVEAVSDPAEAISRARALGLGVGVAFNPETAVEQAAAAAEGADLALCMSIHPGLSGQEFMAEAYERIAELRTRLGQSVLVQVDGGVHEANIARVREAGADLFVAGSAIFWKDDPGTAYEALADEVASPARSA